MTEQKDVRYEPRTRIGRPDAVAVTKTAKAEKKAAKKAEKNKGK